MGQQNKNHCHKFSSTELNNCYILRFRAINHYSHYCIDLPFQHGNDTVSTQTKNLEQVATQMKLDRNPRIH